MTQIDQGRRIGQGRRAAEHRGTAEHVPGVPGGAALMRVKVRLQFTGWLQYALNAGAALVAFVLAGLGWLLGLALGGAWPAAGFWVPGSVGCLLLLALVADLVTVKFGVRPAEHLPRALDGLDAFDVMRARRACRSFQSRDLTEAHRADLLASAHAHTRPQALIGDAPVRLEYVMAPLTVWPVVGAHEFLVAIAPHSYDRMAVIDVGRGLQRVVLDATRAGLATCWIGPGADQRSIARHLGDRFDPERDHIICVCAVGYRSRFKPLFVRLMQWSQHRRLPLGSLFFGDPQSGQPLNVSEPPFDAFGRCYEVCQWSPSSYNAQTTRCVCVTRYDGGREQVARFDFYAATDSRYYAAVAVGIWCADWEAGCEELGIGGYFAVLTPQQRDQSVALEPPRYDVSWIPRLSTA